MSCYRGHDCCEQGTAYHVHTVAPDDCAICAEFHDTGRIPAIVTTEKADIHGRDDSSGS